MIVFRRVVAIALIVVAQVIGAASAPASERPDANEVLRTWYKTMLALVRHTPTYSPPVASRSFAYAGVTAYETVASGNSHLRSLAGQLNGLTPVPRRDPAAMYDDALVVHAAMAFSVENFFSNTGPTGQRVMKRLGEKLRASVSGGMPPDVVKRSEDYGKAIAKHILDWSLDDGGAVITNMGFPLDYELGDGKANWIPTSLIAQQQKPLLPKWGANRTFALPDGAACPLPPPPDYSEDQSSDFYKQALEVYETQKNLSPEQKKIARFWSDDPMLSPTPPGHWISIGLQLLEQENADASRSADVLARLGITMADSFVGCWNTKYQFDLLRPVTYIKRAIDAKWEPLLITPPFPEYPSGHSTQSAAAAAVLTKLYGVNFAFEDTTHARDGLAPRMFASFDAAAEEAALSRLYGGIHFRAAIERGLDQGRCIGAYTNALRTRN